MLAFGEALKSRWPSVRFSDMAEVCGRGGIPWPFVRFSDMAEVCGRGRIPWLINVLFCGVDGRRTCKRWKWGGSKGERKKTRRGMRSKEGRREEGQVRRDISQGFLSAQKRWCSG